MTLSKSQYIRAMQCPKMLWMDRFMPDKASEKNLDSIFETGNEVGDLARQYFGNYSLVDFSFDKEKMIADTEKLIECGAKNIAEASFMFDNLFCSVDILHKNPYGWDIIEVKSSTHITDVYINDMAFQYYVLRGAGLNIAGVYNMHINSNYVRYGKLELAKLFTIEDCTNIVLSRQAQVKFNIDGIRRYMAMADDFEPEKDIDICCDSPYECVYKSYCGRHLPTPSVFDIHGLGKKKKYELYHDGIVSFDDIINCKPKLSKNQKLHIIAVSRLLINRKSESALTNLHIRSISLTLKPISRRYRNMTASIHICRYLFSIHSTHCKAKMLNLSIMSF